MEENPGPPDPYGTPPQGGPAPSHPRPAYPPPGYPPPGYPQQPYAQQPYSQQPGGPAYPAPAPYPYPPAKPPSWFLPTPRGARYDHLARTPEARLWRQIVGTLVLACGFVLVSVIVVVAGATIASIVGIPAPLRPDELFGDPVFSLVVLLLSIALVLPVVFGTAALIQRRRPGTLSSVRGRLRWSWLLWCCGLAVLALVLGQGAQVVALAATGGDVSAVFGWAGWGVLVPALVVIVLVVPFQAAAEEYIFRGWVLQAFGAHLRNPVWGIVIGSVVFASLHGYTWVGLIDVFSFGVVMGWLAVRTGGLEAPIALHVVNNMVAFGLSAAAGQLEDALRQGEVPWQSLAGTVVQLSVFAAGTLYLAKKRSIEPVSP
ncbi:CPBP family intramembrane glutamic endopeptidase [Nonomuraea lactucae]|uniref:CPBP family intramembrane glutamic endopeptidase n=1 Tax=Nonomuraea lactucae TaxID=2249762 RepID=UPI000DE1EA64|nr:type II CAAX endopeptidase family protein [Nonomuraea lactucae]